MLISLEKAAKLGEKVSGQGLSRAFERGRGFICAHLRPKGFARSSVYPVTAPDVLPAFLRDLSSVAAVAGAALLAVARASC
jgi:hypothetical protein